MPDFVIRGLDSRIVKAIDQAAREEGISREEWARQALIGKVNQAKLISEAIYAFWEWIRDHDPEDEEDDTLVFTSVATLIGSVAAEGLDDALSRIRDEIKD